MFKRMTRRGFLHTSSAAAAFAVTVLPGRMRGESPNEKLNIAGVGVGGKGKGDIASTSKGQNVVALCDVDSVRGAASFKKFPKAKQYKDFRKMLEQKDIDAVTVSTADHMHGPIALAAIELGKHVYVQKPLTSTVYEARQMRLLAEKKGVVTQMGNQCHSSVGYRMTVQMLQEGVIGKIKEVHSWTNRPSWPQGVGRPKGEDPVPDTLDWDLWLGVAPVRPYVKGAYHPFRWRGFYDFGTGALGDMGCHILDHTVWALELGYPLSVQSEGPQSTTETYPKKSTITYIYPGTKYTVDDTVKVTWYDGGNKPSRDLIPGLPAKQKVGNGGGIYIGEKGVAFVPHPSGPQFFPKEDFQGLERPKLKGVDHYMQWTNACKGEGKTSSHFNYAATLTEMVLLGALAQRFPGQKLDWDGEGMKVTNFAAANAFVRREYRKEFKI